MTNLLTLLGISSILLSLSILFLVLAIEKREKAKKDYREMPLKAFDNEEEVVPIKLAPKCSNCMETGFVTTFERVSQEDPHIAPVGEQKCHCQNKEEDDFSGASEGER
jgi:hypothetical protein